MEENRKQMSEQDIGEVMAQLRRTGRYNDDVLKLVQADLEYGLSRDEVDIYLMRKLPIEVKRKLSEALHEGCGTELVTVFADAGINTHQIETAINYYNAGVPFEVIKSVIAQNMNAHGMKEAYKKVLAQMKAVQGTSEEDLEKVDKTYVDSLFEEMRKIVSQIGYDEKRFDELNAKIKEIAGGKASDKELEELYQKMADKDAIISNQQDNINQANSALARLRRESDEKEEEKKKMQETIGKLNGQLLEKDEQIAALKEQKVEPTMQPAESEASITPPGTVPLKDASGNVVYGIPVHYAIAYKAEGAKEPEVTVIERTERKNVGFASMFAKLSFKKKSRQDIVKLVASGNLTPEQLQQIRIGMEKKLTENQLLNLINNNVPADQMKEIIEIAVLENSMQ
jgi:hypothetical protein